MKFDFHPEADEEFVEAVAYYENCDPGLGIDFSREVYATIQNAVEYPTMWPVIDDEVRRCLVHRFPYGVLYSVEPDGIFILAVMHLHRDPDYWKQRCGTGRTTASHGTALPSHGTTGTVYEPPHSKTEPY
jgi:plasmid stabilization system protein ParE